MSSIKSIVTEENDKFAPPDNFVSHKGFYENLLLRDYRKGGRQLIAICPMEGGKTSLLMNIAIDIVDRNDPPEKIFWRGTFACEFNKFSNYRIYVSEELPPLQLFVDGCPTELPQIRFRDYADLLEKARPNEISVIYAKNEMDWWAGFADSLYRFGVGWYSIFLDEAEDIIPAEPDKENWKKANKFGWSFKHSRKRKTSFYLATQTPQDLFWRVTKKARSYGFLPGSAKYGKNSLTQKAINALVVGQVYITLGSKFEKRHFPPFEPPDEEWVIRNLPEEFLDDKPKKKTKKRRSRRDEDAEDDEDEN